MRSTSGKIAVLISALTLTVVTAACSSSKTSTSGNSTLETPSASNGGGSSAAGSSTPASGASSDASGGTYTAAEVATASGSYQVKPLFAVPKKLPKAYHLAFINPALSYPYFATWSQGMKDAAKFYGVTLDEADMNFKYDTELSLYNQIEVKSPDVVGTSIMNDATYAAVQKDNTKLVLIDATYKDALHFGVDDEQVGKLAIDVMADQASAKIAGAWKGRKVDVVGLTAPNCTPCDARVKASFAEAESKLGIPAGNTFMVTPQGQDPTTSAGTTFTDFLTAHPHDAILVVSYGDETVVGSVNAAKAAHRQDDVLAVSNGGDSVARTALRDASNAGILLAAIDYQPYAEGWNWVEAAIATAMGQSFGTYTVDRALTPQNVDQFYPNDKK